MNDKSIRIESYTGNNSLESRMTNSLPRTWKILYKRNQVMI